MNATDLGIDHLTPEQLQGLRASIEEWAVEDLEAAIERAAQKLSASQLYSVVARAVARHGHA